MIAASSISGLPPVGERPGQDAKKSSK